MILLVEIFIAVVVSFFIKDIKSYFVLSKKTFIYSAVFSFLYLGTLYYAANYNILIGSVFRDFTSGIALTAVLIFVYPIVIAFCEEFIFRLFATEKFGIFFAGLIFTIAHWRPIFPYKMFPILFIFALVQSFIFRQTKSIVAPMITHFAATIGLIVFFM